MVSAFEERENGEPGTPHPGTLRARLGAPQVHGEGRWTPCCLYQPTTPRLEPVGPGQLWEDSLSWRPTRKVGWVNRTVAGGRRARASTGGGKLGRVRGVQPGLRGQAQGVGRWGRVGGAGLGSRGQGGPTPTHDHSRPPVLPAPGAHCGCRCGPPSHPGRCRRRSLRCPHRCPRSRRGWEGSCCSWLQRSQRRRAETERRTLSGARQARGPHPRPRPRRGLLTDSAGAALPAWGASAAEGVPAVVARAAVAAGVGVTLELPCGHTATQRVPGAAGGARQAVQPPVQPPAWQGVVGTHASGRSCPSSRRRTRSRSR